MSTAGSERGPDLAQQLGVAAESVVAEVGYSEDDADESLRESLVARSGQQLLDGEGTVDEVVDMVLIWWREGDGDLVDTLVDAIGPLADNGVVWLLTPKAGRPGHVEPWDISEAAPTAGLAETRTLSVGKDWSGVRLVTPKSGRGKR